MLVFSQLLTMVDTYTALPVSTIPIGATPMGRCCVNCKVTSTPLWRRNSLGQHVCNACGLFERQKEASNSSRSSLSPSPELAKSKEPIKCVNCHTMETPLWRRDENNQSICNACGLYYKLHGIKRTSFKSSIVRRRRRSIMPIVTGNDYEMQKQEQDLKRKLPGLASIVKSYGNLNIKHTNQLFKLAQQQETLRVSRLMAPCNSPNRNGAPLSPPINEREMASTLALMSMNLNSGKKPVNAEKPMSIANMVTL